jgi:membrane-associated phospholipid phosphatase
VPQNLKLHSILVSALALCGMTVSFFFWDQALAQYFKTPALETVFYYSREITNVGLSVHYFVIGILAYVLSRWVRPHARTRKWSLQLLKSLVVIGIAMPLVKFSVGRQRPHLSPTFDSHIFSPFTFDWHFHSLPSGHAQVLFTVATILMLMWPKPKYLYFILAALLSFTRVTIQQHFLSDIIAGATIGYLGTLWVCSRWPVKNA